MMNKRHGFFLLGFAMLLLSFQNCSRLILPSSEPAEEATTISTKDLSQRSQPQHPPLNWRFVNEYEARHGNQSIE